MDVSYNFLYPNLSGLLVEMAKRLKISYNPQEELWAAAEEALWAAGIDFDSTYTALIYTIASRGIIGWLRKDTRSYIPPHDVSYGEEAETGEAWSPTIAKNYGKAKKKSRKEEINPSGN